MSQCSALEHGQPLKRPESLALDCNHRAALCTLVPAFYGPGFGSYHPLASPVSKNTRHWLMLLHQGPDSLLIQSWRYLNFLIQAIGSRGHGSMEPLLPGPQGWLVIATVTHSGHWGASWVPEAGES